MSHPNIESRMILNTCQWPLDESRVMSFVCALLNTNGGALRFGIDSTGNTVGTKGGLEYFIEFERKLRAEISPPPFSLLSEEMVSDARVVTIDVPKGVEPPYLYHGKAYSFQDGKLAYANAQELRRLVLHSSAEAIRWEERFSLLSIDDDLDQDELWRANGDAANRNRLHERMDVTDELKFFGVYKNGHVLNAGDVLFAKTPGQRAPQVRIRAYAYSSNKTGSTFRDTMMIDAPLCRALNEAMLFIARNTSTMTTFDDSLLVRREIPAYPETALREALVNAVAHRDYSSASGGVVIHIYPDRLEIWNSGDLPVGVRKDRLGKDQVSIIRNPTISYVLYLRGLMEQSGRGSLKMVEACDQAGLPKPVWNADPGAGVTVVFQRVTSMGHDDPLESIRDARLKSHSGSRAKEIIVETLKHTNGANRQDLATLSHVSQATVKRILSEMIKAGQIERVGGRRYGRYQLKKEPSSVNEPISYDYQLIIAGCYAAEHATTAHTDGEYCPEKMRRLMKKLQDQGLIRYEAVDSAHSLNHYRFLGFTDAGRTKFLENGQIKPQYQIGAGL